MSINTVSPKLVDIYVLQSFLKGLEPRSVKDIVKDVNAGSYKLVVVDSDLVRLSLIRLFKAGRVAPVSRGLTPESCTWRRLC